MSLRDATTGELLWQFKTGSGIIGQPVTYRGPDGKQYVAVLSGIGGWPGAVVVGGLDTRDDTAALGWGFAAVAGAAITADSANPMAAPIAAMPARRARARMDVSSLSGRDAAVDIVPVERARHMP